MNAEEESDQLRGDTLVAINKELQRMGQYELDAQLMLARKINAGVAKYGHLDLATDTRNWDHETRDEILDAIHYRVFQQLQREREIYRVCDTDVDALGLVEWQEVLHGG